MEQEYLNYLLNILVFLGEIGLSLAMIIILITGLLLWIQITNPNTLDHQK